MYIDFKRLGKKVLRILACVISAFLLLWGGATLYLKITQNYNAVSPADCVARIIMRNGRDWRGTITHYGDHGHLYARQQHCHPAAADQPR